MKTATTINFLSLICLICSINISVAQPLDKQAIKAIDLHIAPTAKLSLPETQTLGAAVIANLSQWRFPLHAEKGQAYTHTLTVEVGDSKYDQTPVGFSFSSGNSDPRAPGFQKANVIPIQCRLTDNANPKQEEQLEITFSAPPSSTSSQKLQERLTDHISSVCFDLLDSLKFLPPPTPAETAASVTKPTWMPSVQVETVPVPQPQPKVENSPAVTLPAASTATAIVSPTSAKAALAPATPEPQETRKQLIIHNQGTPVIIKFGYDRK